MGWIEGDRDQLLGLRSGRSVFPFHYGLKCARGENRIAAHNLDLGYGPVSGYGCLQANDATNVGLLHNRGIDRLRTLNDSTAYPIRPFVLSERDRGQSEAKRQGKTCAGETSCGGVLDPVNAKKLVRHRDTQWAPE